MKPTTPAELTLNRITYSDEGTPGHIQVGPHCFGTLEPPPRDNRPGESCIPPGRYYVERTGTPSFPEHYVLKDVPGREGIVIHAGNFAGDPAKGYKTDTHGCILIGRASVLLNDEKQRQRALILSRSCLKSFTDIMHAGPFWLTINPPMDEKHIIWPPESTIAEERDKWLKRTAR